MVTSLVRRAALAAACLAPAIVGCARAATAQGRWQEIGTTSAGNPVFVAPRSISKAGNGIITATLRVTFTKPVATPKGPLTSSRVTAMFDCHAKRVAVKESVLFLDEKRNKVYERKVVGIPGYGTVILGTLPDVGMKHLCPR